jgi:uncharacterized protein
LSTRSFFPDINLWIALSSANHAHTGPAWEWYRSLDDEAYLHFCRQTQLGLLRLLTTESVMRDHTQTLRGAWRVYERWRNQDKVGFLEEPYGLDLLFQAGSDLSQASPKLWNDAYLAAFSEAAGLTLVTFDRALAGKTKGAVLLE